MTIEINAGDHVLGIWYLAGDGQDWLACAKREGSEWVTRYRFRCYRPDPARDPFSDHDEKSWYTARYSALVPAATVIATVQTIADGLVNLGYLGPGEQPWKFVPNREIDDDDLKAFLNAPFVHWKAESATSDAPVSAKPDRARKSAKRRKR